MKRPLQKNKGGPAFVKRPLLTTGGKQAMLGVKVLERCLDEVQNLENIAPNKLAPQARRKLGQVCKYRPLRCRPWHWQASSRQWHAVGCTKERKGDHGPRTIVTWQLQSAFRASSVRCVRREPVETVEQQVLRGRDSHCGSGMSSSSPIPGWRYPNSDACKRALVSG